MLHILNFCHSLTLSNLSILPAGFNWYLHNFGGRGSKWAGVNWDLYICRQECITSSGNWKSSFWSCLDGFLRSLYSSSSSYIASLCIRDLIDALIICFPVYCNLSLFWSSWVSAILVQVCQLIWKTNRKPISQKVTLISEVDFTPKSTTHCMREHIRAKLQAALIFLNFGCAWSHLNNTVIPNYPLKKLGLE